MSSATVPAPAPHISFFKKIDNFFVKLFGSGNWEKTVSSTITVVAPLLEEAVQLAAGGPAEELVASAVSEAQSDLAAVSALVTSAVIPGTKGFSANAVNILNAIHTNLAQLLAAAEVKNAAKAAAITGIVNTVDGELLAIVQAVSAAAPAPPAA